MVSTLEKASRTPEANSPAHREITKASMTLKPVAGSWVLAPKTTGVSVGSTDGVGVGLSTSDDPPPL